MKLPKNLEHNPGIARRAFIRDATRIHGNSLQYDQVTYDGDLRKTHTIICPFHGPFKMSVRDHIIKRKGCPSCADNVRLPVSQFLTKSNNAIRRVQLANDMVKEASRLSAGTENNEKLSDESASSSHHALHPTGHHHQLASLDELEWVHKVEAGKKAASLAELRSLVPQENRGEMFKSLEAADMSKEENAVSLPPEDIVPVMGGSEVTHGLHRYRETDELSILRETQGGDKYLRGEREALKGSLDRGGLTFRKDLERALGQEGIRRLTIDEGLYMGPHHPILVRCEVHGDFSTTPSNMIVKRIGCPQCHSERLELARRKALAAFERKKKEEEQ
eukprot:GDKJ01026283.1.p1 GENE.GDKJ01026283.1~~GDKJ01026283.1.p1  ORF type:complete len:386 (-),score=70.01 GDKJ01026283.1:294-1292(-)